MAKELTDKEQAFVREYLVDKNAKAAAIRAGYAETTADTKAHDWVRQSESDVPKNKRHVWQAVQDELQARSERVKVTADDVLRLSYEMASYDVRELYRADGSIKPIHEWSDQLAKCVTKVKTKEHKAEDGTTSSEVVEVEFVDRLRATKLTGDHIGVQAFKQVVEVQDGGLSDRMAEARKRMEALRKQSQESE